MSGRRTITVSSRALGRRRHVTVKVYDRMEDMRAASEAYNGASADGAIGITQCTTNEERRALTVTVRLVRGYLGTQIVVHDIHHAATAIYGSEVGNTVSRRAHLNHYNEPFAHLHSDLTTRLVNRLYDLGYYDQPTKGSK